MLYWHYVRSIVIASFLTATGILSHQVYAISSIQKHISSPSLSNLQEHIAHNKFYALSNVTAITALFVFMAVACITTTIHGTMHGLEELVTLMRWGMITSLLLVCITAFLSLYHAQAAVMQIDSENKDCASRVSMSENTAFINIIPVVGMMVGPCFFCYDNPAALSAQRRIKHFEKLMFWSLLAEIPTSLMNYYMACSAANSTEVGLQKHELEQVDREFSFANTTQIQYTTCIV